MRSITISLCSVALALVVTAAHAQQQPGTTPSVTYQETSEGLQKQIHDVLQAVMSKNSEEEAVSFRILLLPENSTWFQDEYGPAFGPRLAAAYRRALPAVARDIQTVYEGNVQRGWTKPAIVRNADPASADSPVDRFLNCMNELTPLYETAFNGNRTAYQLGANLVEPGRMRVVAGDLPGYYVYVNGAFRFIPQQIFLMLPKARPVRIQLDMSLMQSKNINRVEWKYPVEAAKQHIGGKVVIHFAVDTSGNIKEITSVEGPALLSKAVSDAVKEWRFEPTTLDGEAVEVDVNLVTTFQVN